MPNGVERPCFSPILNRVNISLNNGGGLKDVLDQTRRGSKHLQGLVQQINPDRKILFAVGTTGVVLATLVTYEYVRHQLNLEAKLPDLTSALSSIFPIACLKKANYDVNTDPPTIQVFTDKNGTSYVATELTRSDGSKQQTVQVIRNGKVVDKAAREK